MKFIQIILMCLIFMKSDTGPVIIGVLEQSQCVDTSSHKFVRSHNSTNISARVLFIKNANNWDPLTGENYSTQQHYDVAAIHWTVAFDGRSLGNIKITDSDPSQKFINAYYYMRDKLFAVSDNQHIPVIQNKSKLFGGWCEVPQYRPLIIVSQPNYSDPEKWKPFTPDSSYRNQLYVPLKLVIGRFQSIRCPEGPMVNRYEYFDFQPEDIVFYQSYQSITGKKIISIGLNTEKYNCDGPVPSEWSNHWFLLDKGKIDFLGREMTLIDAGDYDNDGQSELLFWSSSYNKDGYVLMYNSFREMRQYVWGYH
jgi:hypothetical protein